VAQQGKGAQAIVRELENPVVPAYTLAAQAVAAGNKRTPRNLDRIIAKGDPFPSEAHEAHLMTRARQQQVSLDDTPFYHCMARCLRRAFLCGKDALTGCIYEHRKERIVDRLRELAGVFAIDVCAYAILENHYHAVLRADPGRAQGWDRGEVVRRWRLLFSGGALVERYVQGDAP